MYNLQEKKKQRAFLMALELPHTSREEVENSLDELAGLVETAGGIVEGYDVQARDKPGGPLLIGKGKAQQLEGMRKNQEFDLLVFNHDLSPSQQRNLEDIIQCPILDRTSIILDIFAGRARTREAKLQVELAQLQHRLTRLAGKGVDLSRLAGGIGTRGPGLTKLEVDRRRIRDKIAYISKELKKVQRHRVLIRKRRVHGTTPVVALAGYTNVGKSTLHRALTGGDTYVDDRLFATLDASARRVDPGEGESYVLVDTVGFIRDLPTRLVAAFRSTLEEVQHSDVLLHVIDSSSKKMQEEIKVVEEILDDLEVLDKPRIRVFNKIDLLDDPNDILPYVYEFKNSAIVSVIKNKGLDDLNRKIQGEIEKFREEVELLIPYEKFGLMDIIYNEGSLLEENPTQEGIYIKAILDHALIGRIKNELGIYDKEE